MNKRQQKAYELALRNEELRQEKKQRHEDRLRLQRQRSEEAAAEFLASGKGKRCASCKQVIKGLPDNVFFRITILGGCWVDYSGIPRFTCSPACSRAIESPLPPRKKPKTKNNA